MTNRWMNHKKTLISIILAGALALVGTGCDTESFKTYRRKSNFSTGLKQNLAHKNELLDIQPQYETKSISGKIINVDEDSFPIYIKRDYGGGGANFQYELIRVQDNKGEIKQLLSPMPTGYQVGDNVEIDYKELSSISFSKLLKEYGNNPRNEHYCIVLQKGKVKMDGLLLD